MRTLKSLYMLDRLFPTSGCSLVSRSEVKLWPIHSGSGHYFRRASEGTQNVNLHDMRPSGLSTSLLSTWLMGRQLCLNSHPLSTGSSPDWMWLHCVLLTRLSMSCVERLSVWPWTSKYNLRLCFRDVCSLWTFLGREAPEWCEVSSVQHSSLLRHHGGQWRDVSQGANIGQLKSRGLTWVSILMLAAQTILFTIIIIIYFILFGGKILVWILKIKQNEIEIVWK